MVVINLFGSPSSGKTTAAHLLVGSLKTFGVQAEFSGEIPKEMIYAGDRAVFQNQMVISALQYKRLHDMKLYGVEIAVTDAPLLLQKFYARKFPYGKELSVVLDRLAEEFDNKNVLIHRVKEFNPKGRVTDEQHSVDLALELSELSYDLQINGNALGYAKLLSWTLLNFYPNIKK